MKKIIAIVLTAGIMLGIIPAAGAVFTDVENSREIDVITGLKLMEGYTDGTFLPENNITRSEFAQIMANVYNYGNENDEVASWKESFFKDIEEETSLILVDDVQETAAVFDDVSENDEAYGAIKLVSDKGIMVGVSDTEFDPEGNITTEQMIKVVVGCLGYGVEAIRAGGYPNGYLSVASDLGLTKNLTDLAGYATRKDAAAILYNSLDIELMQLKIKGGSDAQFQTVEGETFLTKLLNLQKIRGRMTDDGYSTFSGISVVGKNNVVIDSNIYSLGEDLAYVRNYLGRDVECYYNEDNEIIYAMLSGKDTAVEINISEFEDFEENKITYLPADSKNIKNISIQKGAMAIKNGTAIGSYDKEIFDFNYGNITCITPRGESGADLIIIKEYINFNIDFVDTANKKLYSENSLYGRELDYDDSDKRILVYDGTGNLADVKILTAGMVTSVCAGENVTEIYVSNKAAENFKVDSVIFDEEDTILSGGDVSYIISKDFLESESDAILPRTGGTYTLYLDIFGNVVKYKKAAGDGDFAVITNVRLTENEQDGTPEIIFNYYDLITGTAERVVLPESFTLIYESEKSPTVKRKFNMDKNAADAYNIMYEYILDKNERIGGLCRYKMDQDANIIQIELAAKQKTSDNEDDRLAEIIVDTSKFNGNKYCAGYIGGQVIVSNTTKVIACNYESEGFDYGEGFVIGTKSLFKDNEELKKVKSYTTSADSPIADYVIYTKDVATGISTNPQTVGIVRKIYQGLDSDDEPVQIIQIDAGSTEYVVVDDAMAPGHVTNMQGDTGWVDSNGKLHNYIVEKGDIIRYALDENGDIDKVMLVFDENADYRGGLSIEGKYYTNNIDARGSLAGCIDHWNDGIYKYSNPFSAAYNESTGMNNFSSNAFAWMLYSNEDMRVMLGSAVRTGDGYIITTTQNLQSGYAYNTESDDYVINTWSAASATLVEFDGKDVKITTIPISSVKTYENSGSSCDRIFLTSRIGQPHNLIAIRGQLK